jgi:hypothetical protein
MARDFAIKEEDVVATRERELREALKAAEVQKADDPSNAELFNFTPGQPLPPGFVNPEGGTDEHKCVDNNGLYQPTWTQLFLERIVDHQQDPQPLACLPKYTVPLERWVDVPPSVMEALKSAIETHHEHNAKPGDIDLGVKTVHVTRDRRRFHWLHMKSA